VQCSTVRSAPRLADLSSAVEGMSVGASGSAAAAKEEDKKKQKEKRKVPYSAVL
jgi:hypothetical protein